MFRKIDDDFRMIMKDAQRDSRVVSLLRIGSVKSVLSNMLDRLERCQKSLNEFLEEKRLAFPRSVFHHYLIVSEFVQFVIHPGSTSSVTTTCCRSLARPLSPP